MASSPVNCSSSTSASCCCSSQLLDETVGAVEAASGTAGVAPRPMGSSNIWARSAGSGGGAASCALGAVGGAVGGAAGANGAARVGGGAGVAVFPDSDSESSEEQEGWQEYAEEVTLSEEELVLLTFNCPPNRLANAAAQCKPGGIPAGTATAVV